MKLRILHFITLSALLASCSQDELPGTGATVGIAPLHIVSARLQAPGTQTVTRAADVLTTGSIGVFRSKGTGYAETQDNKQYTYTAAKGWQPSAAADTVYLMANDVDVCAYFPYKSTYTDKTAVPLASGKYTGTTDDLTKHDPADICFATNRILSGASVSTDFEMRHAMAMVQLSFERLNYEGTACNVTSVIIKNTKLIGTATLNITDGTYAAPVKAAVKWTPGTATPATGIQVPATGVSETTAALLVPCTLDVAGTTTFSFTVNGQTMSVKVPVVKLPAFEAGKIHRLKFVIHAASITLSDVSVFDWVPGWNVADEPNIDGTLKDYIELGGVKWALANLEYNATYHNYYFAPSATSGNTKMQWNALTPSETGNNTAMWDSDSDPCTRLEPKGTWTMPTKEDFAALKTLPYVWTDNYNGVKGQWFGVGNATVAALSPDRYLFLPAGSSTNAGYWTQTYGTKNNPQSLRIMQGSVPIEEDMVAYDTPLNVRCVRSTLPHAIDIGLDFYIADGNLTATPSGGGYTYTFANEQGYYGGDGSQTDYFCWNTLEPIGEVSQPSWDDARDACRKIGDGNWRTPTKSNIQALMDAGYIWASYTMKGGGQVNGLYFGTTSAPNVTDQNKYPFLPAAGSREGTVWSQIGTNSYYWCSDDSGAGTYFFVDYFEPDGSFLAYLGFSIRCVYDK